MVVVVVVIVVVAVSAALGAPQGGSQGSKIEKNEKLKNQIDFWMFSIVFYMISRWLFTWFFLYVFFIFTDKVTRIHVQFPPIHLQNQQPQKCADKWSLQRNVISSLIDFNHISPIPPPLSLDNIFYMIFGPPGVSEGLNWMKLMLQTHFWCSRWPEIA